ncbi:MAG: hypothetical protein CM15mP6_3640 [Methanobacteriota archaeon]|nr:MAG: hypothetical protein CM15mP6_3640 [Euryarchaeota archaeon]
MGPKIFDLAMAFFGIWRGMVHSQFGTGGSLWLIFQSVDFLRTRRLSHPNDAQIRNLLFFWRYWKHNLVDPGEGLSERYVKW